MTTRNYSNVAVATALNGAVTDVATAWVVDDGSTYPAVPFTARCEDEVVLVTAKSGTLDVDWTVEREFDGTTKVAHSDATAVDHVVVAKDFVAVPAWLAHLADRRAGGETLHADDDEFDDDTIDAAWTYVKGGAGVDTRTEKLGRFGVLVTTATGDADLNVMLKAIPGGSPTTVQLDTVAFATPPEGGAVKIMPTGLCFTDGTGTTANVRAGLAYHNNATAGEWRNSSRTGTLAALVGDATKDWRGFMQPVWQRSILTVSSGLVEHLVSPDGVNYFSWDTQATLASITHMGFCWSSWDAAPAFATFEFFRVTVT